MLTPSEPQSPLRPLGRQRAQGKPHPRACESPGPPPVDRPTRVVVLGDLPPAPPARRVLPRRGGGGRARRPGPCAWEPASGPHWTPGPRGDRTAPAAGQASRGAGQPRKRAPPRSRVPRPRALPPQARDAPLLTSSPPAAKEPAAGAAMLRYGSRRALLGAAADRLAEAPPPGDVTAAVPRAPPCWGSSPGPRRCLHKMPARWRSAFSPQDGVHAGERHGPVAAQQAGGHGRAVGAAQHRVPAHRRGHRQHPPLLPRPLLGREAQAAARDAAPSAPHRGRVNECEASAMLPLECRYLNKSALTTLAGPLTPPVKHFQLKRKPKSATLRAELLQKSTETAQQLKRSAGVPFHAKGRGLLRKMDTTTPLKGIPKQAPFRSPTTPSVFSPAGNRTPIPPSRTPLRKERGVKLLDISELDMVGAGREAKRRRKTLDAEVVEKPAKEETVVENATPDYAAGLVSTQKLGSLNSEPALPSTSYLPATPSAVPASSYVPSSETPAAGLQASRPPEEPSTPSPALPAQFKQRAPMYNSGPSPATSAPSTPTSPLTPTTPPAVTPAAQTPPVAMVAPQTQPPAQQQPKKNLSLTREQMFAAQEMFKTANKVTRPEKALILGFMAGSRENPCQEQGDVIQIKLSEHTEDLPKSDGQGSTTMLVDTVFEMNYATGQWTRFKKYKPMANVS
ncbi:negative elongation factor A isoform X2 [Meles meles]|uniref:negative elongation factor A isoform X2 n=1 Tax=Meles meles TaxID=9662 RepID=UPI001E69A9FF|nr:negative elongation factor A isoform X2 [Meles meles]